jgi:hypothetical protein
VNGESIAQRSQRSQRGEWELMAESFLVKAEASVRELREWGKHRTEVTEVTEREWELMAEKVFGEGGGFGARTT